MSFRDDRDALLAQADALRVQLAEAQDKLAAAGVDEDEAELKREVDRLRDQVESLQEHNAELRQGVIAVDEQPEPARAPRPVAKPEPPVAPPAPREIVGSTIRGPAPELPPVGNPWFALLALVGILAVAAAFAALALSGS